MLGITACAMASVQGAERVIVCDTKPDRLERSKDFGATDTFDASGEHDLSKRIVELTGGYGVDITFELSGSIEAVELGLKTLRIGGQAIWVGTTHPTQPVKVIPEDVVRRMLAVHGVHNYTPEDLQAALRFLEETTVQGSLSPIWWKGPFRCRKSTKQSNMRSLRTPFG